MKSEEPLVKIHKKSKLCGTSRFIQFCYVLKNAEVRASVVDKKSFQILPEIGCHFQGKKLKFLSRL